MKNWRQLLGNERGTALALALIILVIITGLAVGLAAMGGVESRISAGQSAGSRARLLAESGIEYAYLSLAGGSFSPGTVLIPAGTILPGLTAASGTFGVTIRNDKTAGDMLRPGPRPSTTSARRPWTRMELVQSSRRTGTVDGATRAPYLAVSPSAGVLPLDAALTLPGVRADAHDQGRPMPEPDSARRIRCATTPSTGPGSRQTGRAPARRRERLPLKLGVATRTPRYLLCGQRRSTVEDGFDATRT